MISYQATKPVSVSVEEAARLIGVARSMFYELLARREIKSFKLGRRRLILFTDLEAFVNVLAHKNNR